MIQTINVFLSGAVDKYKFDDSEISIMCASHYCEDFHLKVIDSMLEKLGLNLNNLIELVMVLLSLPTL